MSEVIHEEIVDSDGVTCYIKRGDLVRCKECECASSWNDIDGIEMLTCERLHDEFGYCMDVEQDFYCWFGKRR